MAIKNRGKIVRKMQKNPGVPARQSTIIQPAPLWFVPVVTEEMVPLNQIGEGPIRHASLPKGQMARIAAIYETFAEHHPDESLEQWAEPFRRDRHPEKEIVIFERMAARYKLQVGARETKEDRKRLYDELLKLSLRENPLDIEPAAN